MGYKFRFNLIFILPHFYKKIKSLSFCQALFIGLGEAGRRIKKVQVIINYLDYANKELRLVSHHHLACEKILLESLERDFERNFERKF